MFQIIVLRIQTSMNGFWIVNKILFNNIYSLHPILGVHLSILVCPKIRIHFQKWMGKKVYKFQNNHVTKGIFEKSTF